MIDDPRNKLRELEQQQYAAEETQVDSMLDEVEFQAIYDEILKELDSPDEDLQIRNYANEYGRKEVPAPPLPVPDRETSEETQKIRGNGCLVFVLCLELLSILAVLGFWALFMMG